MKAYIYLFNYNISHLSTEHLLTLERDSRPEGLCVKYNNKWERLDNYICFDNGLRIHSMHIAPIHWRNAKFLYQEDNKLFFEWDDELCQAYFSDLFHDMLKTIDLVDKDKLWFSHPEIVMLTNKLNSLKRLR